MKKSTISISGMRCEGCETHVRDSLEGIGIRKVEVSHKEGKAVVTFDESKVNLDQIKMTIQKGGYGIKGVK